MTGLLGEHDLVILDLDGVVILGDRAIDGAADAVARIRDSGVPLLFVTNNASRSTAEVATLLTSVGVSASPEEVLTSAGAAAAILAHRLPPRAPVLVVGSQALCDEVASAGLLPVTSADERPSAVAQGFGPQVSWPALAEACVAVRAGAWWVVTNTDRTLPTPRGQLPGNGALVAALATALDRSPDLVVGKPEPTLFHAAAAQASATRPLVVGDRLDTDIVGAYRAGMDSLLVLTGVTDAEAADKAQVGQRPTHIRADLRGLFATR